MIATAGIIRVEMKKNNESRHAGTRAIDSAYAAGVASTITKIVDITEAVSELMKYGAKLRARISRYWSNVGVNRNVGGSVDAADSCLKPVTNIHSTGKKNTSPASQARIPDPTEPVGIRRVRRVAAWCFGAAGVAAGGVAVAVLTAHSSRNRLEITRNANVAITMVPTTTITPAAAASPTSNARNACR